MRTLLLRIISFIGLLVFCSYLGIAAETNLVKNAKFISCGYYLGSQIPECVADGNLSSYWSCGLLHSQWGEHWLVIDFGGVAELTRFVIKHSEYANLPGTDNTREFAVEIGPSFEGPWQEVYYVHNQAQENQNEVNLSQPVQSRYVRLHITSPNYFGREDNFVRIAEIEFWGTMQTANSSTAITSSKALLGFNLIGSVQAATQEINSPIPSTNPPPANPKIARKKTASPVVKADIKGNVLPIQVSSVLPGKDYTVYLGYAAMGIGGIILLILLVTIFRWISTRSASKKQEQKKQEMERIRLQKKQEEDQVKAEKQQAVAAKFQEYYDAGMKAMDEDRLEDAVQAFYQAQGLRPDFAEVKSKLVYCKNLLKAAKGKVGQTA